MGGSVCGGGSSLKMSPRWGKTLHAGKEKAPGPLMVPPRGHTEGQISGCARIHSHLQSVWSRRGVRDCGLWEEVRGHCGGAAQTPGERAQLLAGKLVALRPAGKDRSFSLSTHLSNLFFPDQSLSRDSPLLFSPHIMDACLSELWPYLKKFFSLDLKSERLARSGRSTIFIIPKFPI